MSDSSKHDEDIMKLNNPRDSPLLCVQVQNKLQTKKCEQAIKSDFQEPMRHTVV